MLLILEQKKLADVLKNLPGVEVNEDGRIEVEGQGWENSD